MSVMYEKLMDLVKSCKACPLAAAGVGVPGEFVDVAWEAPAPPGEMEVMVIGEAPGGVEQQTGRPFVGSSGELLRAMLDECGLEEYYITNVAKHRPWRKAGKQQKPSAEAITACAGFLRAEINMVKPKKVILLGVIAAAAFIPEVKGNTAQGTLVNRVFGAAEGLNVRALVLYHPAYFLHNRTARYVNKQINDWKRALRNFLGAEIPTYPIERVRCEAHD